MLFCQVRVYKKGRNILSRGAHTVSSLTLEIFDSVTFLSPIFNGAVEIVAEGI